MAKDAKKKDEEKEEDKDAADKGADENKEGAKKEGGEGEAAEGEGAAPPKKSKKKLIIIGALALLLIIGGVAGAYFAGLFGGGEGDEEHAAKAKAGKQAVYYTMPEFLVNLNTGGKQTSYLKTTIVLELNGAEDVLLVEANLPRLFDTLNTYMRELRASDLAGSAGIQRLREELLVRTNKALSPIKINDILFKEIIVQ